MKSKVVAYNGRQLDGKDIQIYSHRGARGLGPENTMVNYAQSLRIGVDYVDMDVNMTADGVLAVTAGERLNPDITRNAEGEFIKKCPPIHDLTFAELQEYNVGEIKPGTVYAGYFPDQLPEDVARIPALDEVIEFTKEIAGDDVGFQIEIKNDPSKPEESATPDEYAEALYETLKEHDIVNRTEVQAFDFSNLIKLNAIDATVKTAYLTVRGKSGLKWTGGVSPNDFDNSFPKMVSELGGAVWDPYEMDLSKKELEEAHDLGLKVVVWGSPGLEGTQWNYPQISRLMDWEVDGIISDRPDELRGVLARLAYDVPQNFQVSANQSPRRRI